MAISIAERAGTLWLTLLRPPVNAIDLDMVRDIADCIEQSGPSVPVILTGKGKTFSAGVDTGAFTNYTPDERREMVTGITRMLKALVCHRAPVLAAINGHAIGGGLVLALSADYRIAGAPESQFALTEARAGIPFPAGAAELIRHELPAPLLRNMTLSGRAVTQAELHEAGVFDQVCKPDDLAVAAGLALRKISDQPAFATLKRQVRGTLQARLTRLVESGSDPFIKAFGAG